MGEARDSFMKLLRFIGLTIVVVVGLASIIATGGGGGGGGGSASSLGGTGSVALYVADGAADSYDEINIWITRVELIPADGGGGAPVVIYKSPDPNGHKINLLDYRDEDFFLTLKPNVPAGWYEKVRLYVANIESVGGPCELEFIKLPSGKIDLNPREPFQVKKGEALAIRLDIDANKSINLHEAGNSGKCIFRPVVFVDIEPLKLRSGCPEILTGTILKTIDTSALPGVNGFSLVLPDGRGTIEVRLSDSTAIFDKEGLPQTSSILADGQSVWVRGQIDSEGKLNASIVVVGQVVAIDGKALSNAVQDDEFVFFRFEPDVGEAFVGEVDIHVYDERLVFVGCDTPVDWKTIQQDRRAKVVGKYVAEPGKPPVFRAAVVFLKELEISGKVLSVSQQTDGLNIIVEPIGSAAGTQVLVFVPSNAPVYLEGDGEFPRALLCEGREVRVVIDPTAQPALTAKLVQVKAEILEGVVTQPFSSLNHLLVVDSSVYVGVQAYATMLDLRNGKYEPIDIGDIGPGDKVRCFGVHQCAGPLDRMIDFYAFVILVID